MEELTQKLQLQPIVMAGLFALVSAVAGSLATLIVRAISRRLFRPAKGMSWRAEKIVQKLNNAAADNAIAWTHAVSVGKGNPGLQVGLPAAYPLYVYTKGKYIVLIDGDYETRLTKAEHAAIRKEAELLHKRLGEHEVAVGDSKRDTKIKAL